VIFRPEGRRRAGRDTNAAGPPARRDDRTAAPARHSPARRPPADVALVGVAKTFGPLVALDEVHLTVPAGSFVACMGANGAGKTTLLRVVAGLATPTTGTVTVAGVDHCEAGPGVRAMIGFVGHASMLYRDLTVRENLAFHASLHELPTAVVARTAARLDIAHALDRPARELSRGNLQRAALARALLHDPSVVLLDEPFTGLDLASGDRLASVLATLHGHGHTIVMSVHDAAHAVLAERLVVLRAGRVVADQPAVARGDVDAVLRRAAGATHHLDVEVAP
jgi:heme ABC exporter ATP-binding subunit CcmA